MHNAIIFIKAPMQESIYSMCLGDSEWKLSTIILNVNVYRNLYRNEEIVWYDYKLHKEFCANNKMSKSYALEEST